MDPLEQLYYAFLDFYTSGKPVGKEYLAAGYPRLFKCPTCGAFSTGLWDACPRPTCTNVTSIEVDPVTAILDLATQEQNPSF